MESKKALQGLKVLELGDYVSAPFCAKLLAELGAEVIKVEPPDCGDSSRRNGPFPDDVPDPEASGLYLFLNTNKRSLTLDVGSPTGTDIFRRLLGESDVLVENLPSGRSQELRLDYPSLRESFPRLIVTSISHLGETVSNGAIPACDLNVQAAGGVSIGVGMPDREPLALPLSQGDFMTGLAATASTLMAVLAREVTGRGQLVAVEGVAVLAGLISLLYFLPTFIYRGVAGKRKGKRGGEAYFPNTLMLCKDGYVCLYPLQMDQYLRFLEMIGNPEWQNEPRYRSRRAMAEEYPDEAEALVAPWFLERTKEEIFKLCMEHKVPCAPVRTIEDVVRDSHLQERGYFVEMDHPVAGRQVYPGSAFRLRRTPGGVDSPAPLLGQHNIDVYCGRLGLSQYEVGRLRMAGII